MNIIGGIQNEIIYYIFLVLTLASAMTTTAMAAPDDTIGTGGICAGSPGVVFMFGKKRKTNEE